MLAGLARDGGLYLPTHYPPVDGATLAALNVTAQQLPARDMVDKLAKNSLLGEVLASGLRAVADFEYEFQMVGMNRAMDAGV